MCKQCLRGAFPLIRLAIRSTPCPQFGIVVFEQGIAQILVASLSQSPRASALRQARVSGGNLRNCAPSAACGGAYAPALFCRWQGRYSGSRMGEGFYRCALCKKLGCSAQLSQSATPDSRIQPRPRGTPMQSARACAVRPKGENEESPGRSLLQTERFKFFPATGGGWAAVPPSSLKSAAFTSQTGSLLLSSLKKVTYLPVPSFLTSPRGRTPP